MESSPEDRCRGKFIPSCYLFAHICTFLFYLPGALLMRDVSWIMGMSRLGDFDQAISWAQKGLDVTIAARQSRNCDGCDEAYLILLYHLASLQQVSFYYYYLVIVLFI
jgi:hypothetical protein